MIRLRVRVRAGVSACDEHLKLLEIKSPRTVFVSSGEESV